MVPCNRKVLLVEVLLHWDCSRFLRLIIYFFFLVIVRQKSEVFF